MWTCAGVLVFATCVLAITRDQFYPYGPGLDQKLPRGHEVPSPEVPLRVPVVFYGETYESVFVNNFGVLTFRADLPSFINTEFPLPYASIAAFYSNVDTSAEGSVFYRETDEPHVIAKAEESVQNNFHDYYDFKPTSVFIATWLEVPYTSPIRDRKNSYQIAIISNGTETFVELLYPERDIQWIQREADQNSLPDAKAQAGFIAEDGRVYTLRGSGSHQIRNIISWSNTHEPGQYVFRVGNISPEDNVAVPDNYNQFEDEAEEELKTCTQSGPRVCHTQAKCVDYQSGICCQCNEGFYGNGKSCIKNDVPLRMHGKLNGIINDVHLNNVDIQAYIVVAEGRSYTALSMAPASLGSSLQLLNVLGGVVGWLFAKPTGNAKNGYQLTGSIFNHTADIWLPNTNDRVTIHQQYYGHDVFDQIIIDSDVRGTLPILSKEAKLEISEYEEQYSIVEQGLLRSDSSRTYTDKLTGKKYLQRITQTVSYSPCRFAPASAELPGPVTLKVSKNYLGYEAKDNIIRYGTSNKIVPLGQQEDPCVRGRQTCGPHSTCVAQGESHVCVCESGFTNIYIEDAQVCVDIDECVAGTHNCDNNADCYNHEGGFQCRCRVGFEGNGVSCNQRSNCQDRKCDRNARCVESAEGPICICNPGFTGDGLWCWQLPQYICEHCSPYASCSFSPTANEYSCNCNPGYIGDGYECLEDSQTLLSSSVRPPRGEYSTPRFWQPPPPTPPSEYQEPYQPSSTDYASSQYVTPASDSPAPSYPDTSYATYSPFYDNTSPAASEAEYNDSIVLPHCEGYRCMCPDGYVNYRDERNNDLCRRESYTVPVPTQPLEIEPIGCNADTDCPTKAVCIIGPESNSEEYSGHCVCPEGYDSESYECIEHSGSNCSCGLNAQCIDTASGDFICACNSGYHGDGYVCRPNFSCTNNSDCEYNAECRPSPVSGEYICQCIEGYVKDQNDACIPDGNLCNGAVCAEHASCLFDEELNVHFCHCDRGFQGEATTKCVAEGQTCDVTNDCSEDAVCTLISDGYQCECKEGFTGDGFTCTPEVSCLTNPYLCSAQASCLLRSYGYECECNTGYSGNGTYCELDRKLAGNFLVVSEGATIYRVPFKVTPREYATPFNSGIDQIVVGIDVDCASSRVYWGDVVGNTIKRAAYDGSGLELFLSNGVKAPEGISIDWAGRNIFWTDSKKLSIEVANLDTKVRKVLFAVDGISNPRGIAVHPQRGKVFWSDWKRSEPKIEWSNMDGSQRGVFLSGNDVSLPNSLAIDFARERLCYADAGLLAIKCVDIDTLERETIAASVSHPFSLAIDGDIFYWTDWKTLKIEYADPQRALRSQLPIAVSSRPYGLAVAPAQCPSVGSVCMHRNGGCQPHQLCLPNGQGSRTCVDGDASYNDF